MDISDENLLLDAFDKAIKSAKWKATCQRADHDSLQLVSDLSHEIKEGSYRTQPFSNFVISERGKTRVISGNTIKDRTLRHALCDNVLMPAIEKYVIYDNSASQIGKGVDFARRRFKKHLQRFYREHGYQGYVLTIDFSKYYDNILHDIAYEQLAEHLEDQVHKQLLAEIIDSFKIDVSYMTDEEYANSRYEKFDSIQYQTIPKETKTGCKYLRKSVPIGDQTSQVIGVFYPHKIDNYCKIVKSIKHYGRYMDDIYIIHEDKEFLWQIYEDIKAIASELGLHINDDKTQLYRTDKPFHFLQNLYYITPSGRVVEKISKKRYHHMRRKLRKLAEMVKDGERDMDDVVNVYRSWMGAYHKIMSKQQIKNMEELCTELFGKEIPWKKPKNTKSSSQTEQKSQQN